MIQMPQNPQMLAPKKHMFGAPVKKENGMDVGEVSNQLTTLSRRLRMVEEGLTTLRNKNQLTDENMLTFNKRIMIDIKTITSEIDGFNKSLDEIKEKIMIIIDELKTCARKADVQVIERYVNMWEPIKFVTQKEVDSIVEKAIGEKIENFKKKQDI